MYEICLTKIEGTHWAKHFNGVDEMQGTYGPKWREVVDKKVKDYVALKTEKKL